MNICMLDVWTKKNVPCFSDISLYAAEKLTKYLPTYLEVDRDRPTAEHTRTYATINSGLLDKYLLKPQQHSAC